MKRFFVYLTLTFTLLINIYLIFCWQPQGKNVVHENTSEEVVSYKKSLYKIDKNQILEELSSDDKKNLDEILKKLSTLDMGKIKGYFEESNDDEGVVNSFTLLKKRLKNDDYKKIEDISSSFLDIDKINQEIKNKKID
ncbi:hypothetical protein [Clostridium sp.]|uniref:hypothetical protein n=1 Tax=Clostridium sp. TaxID=1506 RepID=UPI00284403C9|nr:hypothetical protein [Clostridium sp.]MDR3595480.1 hypothetical protein [Clostridium sp.]